jgi:hypothetical protein
MRRPFLQFPKNRSFNCSLIPPQLRIPKPQFLNSFFLQVSTADTIMRLSLRKSMLGSIQFNGQLCFGTEEIQKIFADRILPAKFVFGKTPVAQPSPHQLLSPSRFLA